MADRRGDAVCLRRLRCRWAFCWRAACAGRGRCIGVVNMLQTIPEPGDVRLSAAAAVDRRARGAHCHCRADGYALLPILRNTYAGIAGSIATVIDVAEALGMTSWQRLCKVELPLAMPFILAGLRTATVTCVGIATIAAAVGAGGLGELIFRGVASVDNRLVLAGAVPAALLALAADGLLGLLEGRCGAGYPAAVRRQARCVAGASFILLASCYACRLRAAAAGPSGYWGEELYRAGDAG